MALNSKMHIRNPYKEKLNFEHFFSKYSCFRNVVQKSNLGKLYLDFKNHKCQQALSWCILKEDFDLDVMIPVNKLIPTIPLRLNYILWIEDILNVQNLCGIDIGCGASCIYPLLGAKKNNWHFLATESDPQSYDIAVDNVARNKLNDQIKVIKVNDETCLSKVIEENLISKNPLNTTKNQCLQNVHFDKDPVDAIYSSVFHFVMCNPPFFDQPIETSNKNKFTKRRNIYSTADVLERTFYDRGEVGFIQKVIIDASLKLRNQIRVYSTMLGKKESQKVLIKILKDNKVENIGITDFCQGNTMRWGLAWSFDKNVKFPVNKCSKETNLSFSFNIDKCNYIDWDSVMCKIEDILLELEVTNICNQ